MREDARVVPRSKQPRRSQAAEEMRGPPRGGRAQEGKKDPDKKVSPIHWPWVL